MTNKQRWVSLGVLLLLAVGLSSLVISVAVGTVIPEIGTQSAIARFTLCLLAMAAIFPVLSALGYWRKSL